jgi:hypothetical protein
MEFNRLLTTCAADLHMALEQEKRQSSTAEMLSALRKDGRENREKPR